MEARCSQLMLPWGVLITLAVVSIYAQTVPDKTPPVVYNCPQRDSYILTQHEFVFVNLGEPSAIDVDSPPVRIDRTIAPGFYVDVGFSKNVTYTFTDRVGNRAVCSFAVHAVAYVHCQAMRCQNGATCIKDQVLDDDQVCVCPVGYYGQFCEKIDHDPPVVTNCPTQEFYAFAPVDGGQSYTLVSWIEPLATDNGALIAIDKTHEPMTKFPPGRTEVKYTFADAARNVAFCSFNVMIYVGDWKLYDGVKPHIYSCPSTNVVITLKPGITESLVGWAEPWARDNSGKLPTKTNNIGPRSTFSLGRTQVEYTFADEMGNTAMCAFDVILINSERPLDIIANNWDIVNCPMSTIMANVPSNENSVMVMWNEPTAVARTSLSFTMNKTHTPGEGFPVGGTEVIYRFSASDGTKGECKFSIVISQGRDQPKAPVIVDPRQTPIIDGCPSNIGATLPFGTKEAIVDWSEPRAYSPGQKDISISKSYEPNSQFLTNQNRPYSVQYIFTDSDGLSSICTFSIDLKTGPMEPIIPANDNTRPRVYDCPGNIETDAGISNTAILSWTEPYATDNSGVTPRIDASNRPLDRFTLGQTVVRYTFSDLSGNSAECSFMITVTGDDIVPPKITNCINSFTVKLQPKQKHVSIYWPEPAAKDDSGMAPSKNRTHTPGDFLPLGVSTVSYTFTDSAKNKAVCSFNITVVAEPVCEYKGASYASFAPPIDVNRCSSCLCVAGIWYCEQQQQCDEVCPLVFPTDFGITCNSFGGPDSALTPCNTDFDCATFNTKCCSHVCGGGNYCTKPQGTPCSISGIPFNAGEKLRSVISTTSNSYSECYCTLGDWHCKKFEGCMYNGRQFFLEESRLDDDGCNTCTCSDGGWSCTEIACALPTLCRNVECAVPDNVGECTGLQQQRQCCPTYQCPQVTNPGSCPVPFGEFLGTCAETCEHDGFCTSGMKCCSNGCGRVCMQPEALPAVQGPPLMDLYCMYEDVRYEDGTTMSIGGCSNCKCRQSTLSCAPSISCPIGRKKRSTREFVEHLRTKSTKNIRKKVLRK